MGASNADLTRLRHSVATSGGGSVVLKLDGELDMLTAGDLAAAVADAVAAVKDTLVVDVEELQFADSSGIALWVAWSQQVSRIEIRNARPMVARVIQAMGLSTILNPS